jgi:hypothetical protein
MHHYRVTKYDPAFRDSSGVYTKKDWTSFGDVGSSHEGGVLSLEEYLRVESAYIDIAREFIGEDGCPTLKAIDVENHSASAFALNEGSLISGSDLPAVCRSILRGEFWCRLEAGKRFVHFGYDYYMYVGVESECLGSIAAATARGLFVERFDSPYIET